MVAQIQVHNYQRDGVMNVNGNQGGAPNYFPNSFNGAKPSSIENVSWHQEASTADVARYETGNEDNFTQCGHFYRNVLTPAERERLTDNIANNLSNAQEFLQARAVTNFAAVDANYGKLIKAKLDIIKKAKDKNKSNKSTPTGKVVLSPKRIVPSKI